MESGGAVPIPSPYFSFFMRTPAFILALILVGVLGGGGVALAAAGALPGDTLYAIKTDVNEPVERVLALSDDAKADVDIAHAEERLREVELLAASGDTARADAAAEAAAPKIAALRNKLRMLPNGAAVEAKLALALSAHADILAAQSEDASTSPVADLASAAREDSAGGNDDDTNSTDAVAILLKAHALLSRDDVPEDARDALTSELAVVEDELSNADGDPDALSAATRHAYRVLALAEAAKRIANKTGKDVFIRFTSPPSGVHAAVAAKVAAFMATSAPAEDSEADEGSSTDRFNRHLEFRVLSAPSGDDSDQDATGSTDEDSGAAQSGSEDSPEGGEDGSGN
jgi:hypothetical protein